MDSMNLIEDITSFINSRKDVSAVDEEYYEIEDKFKGLFGHGVPREMIPTSISMDDIKVAMKQCIEKKKDVLFELLGVEVNNTDLY